MKQTSQNQVIKRFINRGSIGTILAIVLFFCVISFAIVANKASFNLLRYKVEQTVNNIANK